MHVPAGVDAGVGVGEVVNEKEVPVARCATGVTLLEARLPFRELSLIAAADKSNVDPAYGIHRWWARRPPGVMRGLLLAAALPSSTPLTAFWRAFENVDHALAGLRAMECVEVVIGSADRTVGRLRAVVLADFCFTVSSVDRILLFFSILICALRLRSEFVLAFIPILYP